MKKSFLVHVEYEEEDQSPLALSSVATWVQLALGGAFEVTKVDVTSFHTVREAMEGMKHTPEDVIRDVWLVESGDAEGSQQICVTLDDGLPRLLNLYQAPGVELDRENYVGKTMQQVQGYTE